MMSIGSLFSGIGGLELGLERAGVGHVMWQAESDPYCAAVLRHRWPHTMRYHDVRAITATTATRVDLVCGGFPCQPVSLAGSRRAQDDERWLWPEFARIVAEIRPAIVVAENVLGLRSAGLRDVLADLAALGFDAEWAALGAFEVGAPHLRRRIFIVATHPERVAVREQQGWLERACRARAAELTADGAQRALADAVCERHAWSEHEPHEGRTGSLRGDRCESADSPLADSDAGNSGSGPDTSTWRSQERPATGLGGRSGEADSAPSDSDRARQSQQAIALAEQRGWARDSGWRLAPSAVRGMDDGLPNGLDAGADGAGGACGEAAGDAPDSWRVGALGNAVVPQCAELVGRALMLALAPQTEVACST